LGKGFLAPGKFWWCAATSEGQVSGKLNAFKVLFALCFPGYVVLALCCVCAAAQQDDSKVVPPKQSQTFAQESSPFMSSLAVSESELRKKVEDSPNSADTLFQLALVLRQEHKYKESLEFYTRAATLQKPDATQLRSVALDYVELNEYDDAIRWLRIALGMEPSNVEILYSLGRCFYTQTDLVKAEAAFTRVLQLQPYHLKAEENLGLTYDGENKPQLAEKALRTAAEWADQRHLNDEWPYIDLGTLLLNQSRAMEATPLLQRAIALNPMSEPAHEKLGRALLGTGKPADAVTQLEKAVDLDPQNPRAHFELGRAYRDSGQPEKARAEFDISKKLYGTHNQE